MHAARLGRQPRLLGAAPDAPVGIIRAPLARLRLADFDAQRIQQLVGDAAAAVEVALVVAAQVEFER